MATQTYSASTTAADVDEERGLGWVMFAATMLGLAGIWNVIDGILAISKSHVYSATGTQYVFSDLKTWGWIVTLVGAACLAATFALFTGSQIARWFGITAAGLNAMAHETAERAVVDRASATAHEVDVLVRDIVSMLAAPGRVLVSRFGGPPH